MTDWFLRDESGRVWSLASLGALLQDGEATIVRGQMAMSLDNDGDTVSTNLRFSWLRTGNTGLYLVYNEVDDQGLGALPRGREFIVKYSHLFDMLK